MLEQERQRNRSQLGLLGALGLLVAVGGALLLGPGSGIVDGVRAELSVRSDQLDLWSRETAAFRAPNELERQGWTTRWEELESRIQPVADQPALVARVAQQLQAPTVRRFEVDTQRVLRNEDEEAEPWTVDAPASDRHLTIEEVPLRVSFRSSYRDALDVLARLEAGQLPARIEAVDVKRDRPGVWMRMDLTYFVRAKGGAS